jgi:hypothetical protein
MGLNEQREDRVGHGLGEKQSDFPLQRTARPGFAPTNAGPLQLITAQPPLPYGHHSQRHALNTLPLPKHSTPLP